MKKKVRIGMGAWSMLFLLLLPGCNKDATDMLANDPEAVAVMLQVEEMVALANQRYLSEEVGIVDGGHAFAVRNDGLIDEYTANEQGYMLTDKQHGNQFLACLRSVEPSREQVQMIRRALNGYEQRNERIIMAHRTAFRQLQENMENLRRAFYRRYQAGYLDQEAYRTQMLALRERYQESLARIRESHAAAFSRSYEQFLRQLEGFLTEEQWAVFTSCVAS